jgi:hypothetical protein
LVSLESDEIKKAPSDIGGRFRLQVDINNYSKTLPFSCLTETCPDPTTEVVNVGLRLDLASIRMLARSLNILGRILLRMKDMSMVLYGPFA